MGRPADPHEIRVQTGCRKPLNATLSGLTIGSLTLTPEFDPDVTEYSATTSNQSNKVTAVATDETATIEIVLNGETEVENGSSAEWEDGENELTITVTDGAYPQVATKVYTVTVTKS